MKFGTFKEVKAVEVKGRVVDHLQRLPDGHWAGRRIVREDSAPDWEIQLLDFNSCLTCGKDLHSTRSPSGAPNITYYTCIDDVSHKFVRVGPPPSGLRRLLNAASGVTSGKPIDDDLDRIDQMLSEGGIGGA